MTALGIYLLISLFFVLATMVELAGVILLRRKLETNVVVKVPGGEIIDAAEIRTSTEKLDFISMILFFSFYVLFNAIYWSYYLFV